MYPIQTLPRHCRSGLPHRKVEPHLLGSSLALVSNRQFVERAVEVVVQSQQTLMDSVYSTTGIQQLLWKLHRQVR